MLGLSVGLTGCQETTAPVGLPVVSQPSPVKLAGRLSEVAPPASIQSLRQALDVYQPQVAIVSPRPDEVLPETTVNVRFQVRDLPIFKDEALGLGPHLHVILDNQPYQAVYDLEQPLVFKDLEPGTHTLRVFAARPWYESFKNDGAYAQVTFHVLTQTATNRPDPKLPVLTYSHPQGRYGAEPILLDFYLTNAPLHLAVTDSKADSKADGKADSKADLNDWRIRVTINGESFVLDNWQPIYLKGFKRGDNWIKLEFLNDRGELVLNAFNNPARLFQYEPGGKDTLSRLMRGELSASAAQGMVKQTLTTPALQPAPPAPTAPVPSQPAAPQPAAKPTLPAPPKPIASPQPSSSSPEAQSTPTPAVVKSAPAPAASSVPAPTPSSVVQDTAPNREPAAPAASPIAPVSPSPTPAPRRVTAPTASPAPSIAPPTPAAAGTPTPAPPEEPAASPAIEQPPTPLPAPLPAAERSPAAAPTATQSEDPSLVPSTAEDIPRTPPTATTEATPAAGSASAPAATASPVMQAKTKVNQWFSRLRDRVAPPPENRLQSPAPSAPAPIAEPMATPEPTLPTPDAAVAPTHPSEVTPSQPPAPAALTPSTTTADEAISPS